MKIIKCELDGKLLMVQFFSVGYDECGLAIRMECVTDDGDAYHAIFQNVSLLNVANASHPFQIGGFEIIDKLSDGYQKDRRYLIKDYEDGTVSFYCESFEIFESF